MTKDSDKTILVIDDEPVVGSIIKRLIGDAGYSVLFCTSSNDAIEVSQQRTPELIISDFNLPCYSNGVDLCQSIRALTNSGVPVIIISGQIENESRARQLGYEFVGKPLRKEKLMPLVESCLNRLNSQPN